jgi:site-specific DNA-methyltransferase (adenine-specific)
MEDAGFEFRDCLMYLYGSGMPKGQNISKAIDKALGKERSKCEATGSLHNNRLMNDDSWSKIGESKPLMDSDEPASDEAAQWDGWHSQLKPAYEPVLLMQKPFKLSIAKNVLEWGTGGLNIDASRIDMNDQDRVAATVPHKAFGTNENGVYNMRSGVGRNGEMFEPHSRGRFPTNVILDEEAAQLLDIQVGNRKAGGSVASTVPSRTGQNGIYGTYDRTSWESYGDDGGPSRFFKVIEGNRFYYTSKASRSEREHGLEGKCPHPTVKPLDLMRYLVRLVTPPDGLVLDPFLGSGTTAMASYLEGFRCVGIEMSEEYIEIAKRRVGAAEGLREKAEPKKAA